VLVLSLLGLSLLPPHILVASGAAPAPNHLPIAILQAPILSFLTPNLRARLRPPFA
jgi:hypothetical protein